MTDELHTDKDNFYIALDSRNATNYLNSTYNSHVKFEFEQAIIFNKRSIKTSCSVLQFSVPNTIYNINETNSYLSISLNGGSYVGYNIPYGNYQVNTFITQLISLIGSSFSISMNPTNYKLTITHSTYNFIIDGASTIYNIMGFQKNINQSSTANTLTMPYMCNFNGLQNIGIYMDNLGTRNMDSLSKSTGSLIQCVQVDPNATLIQFTNNSSAEKFTIYQNTIDYIEISLKDALGNYINLNNQNWNMTICFSVVRDLERFEYMNTFHNTLKYGYTT
jgi:hypothetical protein